MGSKTALTRHGDTRLRSAFAWAGTRTGSSRLRWVLFFCLIAVSLASLGVGPASGEETEITHCYGADHPDSEQAHITSPGNYTISSPLIATSEEYCIIVDSTDVTLDGNNHTIFGLEAAGEYGGILVREPSVSIQDVQISNFTAGDGILVDDVGSVTISNVETTQNYNGIALDGTTGIDNNTISSVHAEGNHNGIVLSYEVHPPPPPVVLEGNRLERISVVNNTEYGIFVENPPGDDVLQANNEFVNITARDNGWEIGTYNVDQDEWQGVDIGASLLPNTTLSFEDPDNVRLDVNRSATVPEDETSVPIGRAFDIDRFGTETQTFDFVLRYEDEDVSLIDETALQLWKYTDTWDPVGSSVSPETNSIAASVSASARRASSTTALPISSYRVISHRAYSSVRGCLATTSRVRSKTPASMTGARFPSSGPMTSSFETICSSIIPASVSPTPRM